MARTPAVARPVFGVVTNQERNVASTSQQRAESPALAALKSRLAALPSASRRHRLGTAETEDNDNGSAYAPSASHTTAPSEMPLTPPSSREPDAAPPTLTKQTSPSPARRVRSAATTVLGTPAKNRATQDGTAGKRPRAAPSPAVARLRSSMEPGSDTSPNPRERKRTSRAPSTPPRHLGRNTPRRVPSAADWLPPADAPDDDDADTSGDFSMREATPVKASKAQRNGRASQAAAAAEVEANAGDESFVREARERGWDRMMLHSPVAVRILPPITSTAPRRRQSSKASPTPPPSLPSIAQVLPQTQPRTAKATKGRASLLRTVARGKPSPAPQRVPRLSARPDAPNSPSDDPLLLVGTSQTPHLKREVGVGGDETEAGLDDTFADVRGRENVGEGSSLGLVAGPSGAIAEEEDDAERPTQEQETWHEQQPFEESYDDGFDAFGMDGGAQDSPSPEPSPEPELSHSAGEVSQQSAADLSGSLASLAHSSSEPHSGPAEERSALLAENSEVHDASTSSAASRSAFDADSSHEVDEDLTSFAAEVLSADVALGDASAALSDSEDGSEHSEASLAAEEQDAQQVYDEEGSYLDEYDEEDESLPQDDEIELIGSSSSNSLQSGSSPSPAPRRTPTPTPLRNKLQAAPAASAEDVSASHAESEEDEEQISGALLEAGQRAESPIDFTQDDESASDDSVAPHDDDEALSQSEQELSLQSNGEASASRSEVMSDRSSAEQAERSLSQDSEDERELSAELTRYEEDLVVGEASEQAIEESFVEEADQTDGQHDQQVPEAESDESGKAGEIDVSEVDNLIEAELGQHSGNSIGTSSRESERSMEEGRQQSASDDLDAGSMGDESSEHASSSKASLPARAVPRPMQVERLASRRSEASRSHLDDVSASLSTSVHARATMLLQEAETPIVEISSLDARAAARASAVLKLHHRYIATGTLLASDAAPSGSRILPADMSTLRGAAEGVATDATMADLLADEEAALAEALQPMPRTPSDRQLVRSHHQSLPPQTPLVPGAFPVTPAARAVPSRTELLSAAAIKDGPLHPEAEHFSAKAWAALNRVLVEAIRLDVRAQGAPESGPSSAAARADAVLDLDCGEVVQTFLRAHGIHKSRCHGQWSSKSFSCKMGALQRRYLISLQRKYPGTLTESELAMVELGGLTEGAPEVSLEQSCGSVRRPDSRLDFGTPFRKGAHSTPVASRAATEAPSEAASRPEGDLYPRLPASRREIPEARTPVESSSVRSRASALLSTVGGAVFGARIASPAVPPAKVPVQPVQAEVRRPLMREVSTASRVSQPAAAHGGARGPLAPALRAPAPPPPPPAPPAMTPGRRPTQLATKFAANRTPSPLKSAATRRPAPRSSISTAEIVAAVNARAARVSNENTAHARLSAARTPARSPRKDTARLGVRPESSAANRLSSAPGAGPGGPRPFGGTQGSSFVRPTALAGLGADAHLQAAAKARQLRTSRDERKWMSPAARRSRPSGAAADAAERQALLITAADCSFDSSREIWRERAEREGLAEADANTSSDLLLRR